MAKNAGRKEYSLDMTDQEADVNKSIRLEPADGIEHPAVDEYDNGTVPDEIPEADAPGMKKVIVPELVSMTKYLFDNYRLVMYSHLNRCLRNGKLSGMTGYRIRDKVINRNVCRFTDVSYWRIDREDFIADVDVELNLHTDRGMKKWTGYLTLWFDMGLSDGKIECHIEEMGSDIGRQERDLVRLSSFLVPYFTSKQMEEAAERIWMEHRLEALTDPKARKASVLAERMGLSIEYHPIHQHDGTESILFFEEGEILTKQKSGDGGKPPVAVRIPADTIVVNTNVTREEYSTYAIFHECFHNEYHYLFYRLQKAANKGVMNNDARNLKTKEILVAEDEKVNNPVFWMEKQANRGAYGLMMPERDTRERIEKEKKRIINYRHAGDLYERIGIRLGIDLSMPHFRLRIRMLQLGYVHAKGALNYADKHMIEPFAFDLDAWTDSRQTFIIDEASVDRMMKADPDFRELMDSGKFIYADGHVVRNEPRFVTRAMRGLELTGWANKHVDRCCLRFEKHYIQKNAGLYVFGRMNYDADYVKQTMFYLDDEINRQAMDELEAEEAYIESFPADFREALDKVRKQYGISWAEIAEKMDMHVKTLRRWLEGSNGRITVDFVMMVTLILKLPDWLSDLLFDRAYLRLSRSNKRHLAMRHIQRVLWMDGIDVANAYLKEKGMEPLTI